MTEERWVRDKWALRRVNGDGSGAYTWYLMKLIPTKDGDVWVDEARINSKDLAFQILGSLTGAMST